MGRSTTVSGILLALGLAACGDSYAPGEEVWIELKGDRAVHLGYALAIVIDQRKDLVEIQVNRLEGGEGNEYLPVLKKGRGFVPVRLVNSRDDGLDGLRRMRATAGRYQTILASDLARPTRVTDKAEARANRYRMRDVQLAFELHKMFNDAFLGPDDAYDPRAFLDKAPSVIRAIKARLDRATQEMSGEEARNAVAEATKLPPATRATHRHAALGHGYRLARRALMAGLDQQEKLTLSAIGTARRMAAAIDAYVEFGWRYDPQVRALARNEKAAGVRPTQTAARRFLLKRAVARLREELIARAVRGLTPPVSDDLIEERFARARADARQMSAALGLELVPADARDVFARAIRDLATTRAKEARAAYIRSQASNLVLAGRWTGTMTCPAGADAASFPLPVRIRLTFDLEDEGVGVFRGGLAVDARVGGGAGGESWAADRLRTLIQGGRLPGEGKARATLRIRVDTETGALRWIRIMGWRAGPADLRAPVEAMTGAIAWDRPPRFSVALCGQTLPLTRAPAASRTR